MYIPFVISGPSGVGKGTIVKALKALDSSLLFSISHTTRPQRDWEINGVHYHFVTVLTFLHMRAQGNFLECAQYVNNWYGTSRTQLEGLLEKGDTVLEIDQAGASQVKKRFPHAVSFFVHPPSLLELERRLRKREGASFSESIIRERLETARREIAFADQFDFQITNENVEQSAEEIRQAIQDVRMFRTSNYTRNHPQ